MKNDSVRDLVFGTQWERPLCITFTEKQVVDGQRIDDIRSTLNVRHFMNVLNGKVYGNAYRRFGRRIRSLFVREVSGSGRHHLHGVLDIPADRNSEVFKAHITASWSSTRFGYDEIDLSEPSTGQSVDGYLHYIMKGRTKPFGLCDAVDWENCSF